jgi:hypothetical protein
MFAYSKVEKTVVGIRRWCGSGGMFFTTSATGGLCAGLSRRSRRRRLHGSLRCCHLCQLSWRSCPLSPCWRPRRCLLWTSWGSMTGSGNGSHCMWIRTRVRNQSRGRIQSRGRSGCRRSTPRNRIPWYWTWGAHLTVLGGAASSRTRTERRIRSRSRSPRCASASWSRSSVSVWRQLQ